MYAKVRKILSVGSFAVAAFLAIASLFIPPRGVIDSSALWAIAQFLVMACTLLEIQSALEKFTGQTKNK